MLYLSINKQTKSHLKDLVDPTRVILPIKPQLLATLARHEASTTVIVVPLPVAQLPISMDV